MAERGQKERSPGLPIPTLVEDARGRTGPAVGGSTGRIPEGPSQSDQVLAGRQDGTTEKIFLMSPQALTGEQAKLEGAVLDSANPPTIWRGKGPVTGEGFGIGLPLLIQTAPKGEEGGSAPLEASAKPGALFWKGTKEGFLCPVLSPLDDEGMVPPGSIDLP